MLLSKCFSEIRGSRPARFATVSLLALSALVGVVTVVAQRQVGTLSDALSLGARLANAVVAVPSTATQSRSRRVRMPAVSAVAYSGITG